MTARQELAQRRDRETRRRKTEYDEAIARMRLRLNVAAAPDDGLFELTGWVAEVNRRRRRCAREIADEDLDVALAAVVRAERELQALLARRRAAYTERARP